MGQRVLIDRTVDQAGDMAKPGRLHATGSLWRTQRYDNVNGRVRRRPGRAMNRRGRRVGGTPTVDVGQTDASAVWGMGEDTA